MPVEIKQLIIRAKVEESSPKNDPTNVDTNDIIEACVKQVLRILRKTKDR